ncbi:hypothetical protein BGW38_002887, partial [Lunasporangiospora selenospora]
MGHSHHSGSRSTTRALAILITALTLACITLQAAAAPAPMPGTTMQESREECKDRAEYQRDIYRKGNQNEDAALVQYFENEVE